MKTILILRDRPSSPMSYFVDHYALQWQNEGYRVIDHVGLVDLPEADVVIVHINLTIIPQEYIDVIKTFPVAINGNILDISRKKFSKLLLCETDSYKGPVIVKTNANYGGKPEYKKSKQGFQFRIPLLSRKDNGKKLVSKQRLNTHCPSFLKSLLGSRLHHFLYNRKSVENWDTVEVLDPSDYPIFEDIGDVPEKVWSNNNLIVERFIKDWKDDFFYTYYYVFFGDKEIAGRIGSPNPIVKFSNCVTDVEVEVPDEVRQWRNDLNIDFGRFDYVESEGQLFLIDVNKTEGGGDMNYQYQEEIKYLASGLGGILGQNL